MTEAAGGTIRAFLAVDMAPAVQVALVALKHELAGARAAVRWVRDDGLHATVKFLGPVAAERLDAVRDALADALREAVPIAAHARGLGAFPSLRRPRVLWVGLDSPPLGRLAAAVDGALASLGFAPESRPFQPHITLGRVNGWQGWARLEPLLKTHWDDDFGASEIRELIGYRSDLRRDGAVYTKLWTIRFGT